LMAAYLSFSPVSFEPRISRFQLMLSVFGIVALTVLVGLFLVVWHVALFQSSH